MFASYLVGMSIAAGVVLVWFGVQQMSRVFHRRHPEALPALETMGCHHCGSAAHCGHMGERSETCDSFGKVEDRE